MCSRSFLKRGPKETRSPDGSDLKVLLPKSQSFITAVNPQTTKRPSIRHQLTCQQQSSDAFQFYYRLSAEGLTIMSGTLLAQFASANCIDDKKNLFDTQDTSEAIQPS